MFALIIAIVSIALIVATIAATMYHGGDTLTQGRDRATAAGVVSGAQQAGGAAVMFLSLEGNAPANIGALVTDGYLSSLPNVPGLAIAAVAGDLPAGYTPTIAVTRHLTATVDSAGVCAAINAAAGDTTPEAFVAADLAGAPYGCVTATRAFVFKF